MEPASALETARADHVAGGERLAARLWPLVRLVAGALAAALIVRALIVQPFAIPSGSMAPGLVSGDFVLVDKRAYGWSPASLPLAPPLTMADGTPGERLFARPVSPGDVIAFTGPGGRDYVKRMVAGPGDTVAWKAGLLQLNGVTIPCVPEGPGLCRETLPNGRSHLVKASAGTGPDFGPVIVPAGHYFVLGDARDRSADSRLSVLDGGVGLVPDPNVIGRARLIFFSLSDGGLSRLGLPIG